MRKLNRIPVYMTPDDASAKEQMDEAWETVVDGRPVEPAALTVKGRTVPVPQASGSAARFSFSDLCEKPLGARDYLAIAGAFDTIFIDHVPTMDLRRRNEAKRFILLIDTLYDAEARLFLSAEAAPNALYTAANGTEAFEFDRTVSRLIEMQSRDWLDRTGARNEEKSAPAGERAGQAG